MARNKSEDGLSITLNFSADVHKELKKAAAKDPHTLTVWPLGQRRKYPTFLLTRLL